MHIYINVHNLTHKHYTEAVSSGSCLVLNPIPGSLALGDKLAMKASLLATAQRDRMALVQAKHFFANHAPTVASALALLSSPVSTASNVQLHTQSACVFAHGTACVQTSLVSLK